MHASRNPEESLHQLTLTGEHYIMPLNPRSDIVKKPLLTMIKFHNNSPLTCALF